MHTFFHGWRRKAGVVTLVMAMAVTVAWARGIIKPKTVELPVGHQTLLLTTNNGRLIWEWANRRANASGEELLSEQRQMVTSIPLSERQRIVRFRTPVLFLTMLSAYLILWRPRKRVKRNA